MKLTTFFVVFALFAFTTFTTTNAIYFALRQGEETCLAKEVMQGDFIKGVYALIPEHEQMSVSVRDPSGDLVYVRPGVNEGSFAYTSPKTGNYKVCFQNNLTTGQKSVKLTFTTSEETKTTDAARKSSLKPIEAQVKHVHTLVQTLKRDEQWIQEKQQDMRQDSDYIQSLVIFFNVMLLLIVIGGYFLQLWYLKSYFRSKRLVD
eukprot:UN02743